MCSNCGAKNSVGKAKVYHCHTCKAIMSRDENGAINIGWNAILKLMEHVDHLNNPPSNNTPPSDPPNKPDQDGGPPSNKPDKDDKDGGGPSGKQDKDGGSSTGITKGKGGGVKKKSRGIGRGRGRGRGSRVGSSRVVGSRSSSRVVGIGGMF